MKKASTIVERLPPNYSDNVGCSHRIATSMGRNNRKHHHPSTKSHTLPSSPTHSSSNFEFTISHSPHKSSAAADELFYNGHLLPLRLSSSSSSFTTASHSSFDHHFYSDSSRPSSAADEELNRLSTTSTRKPSKYFSPSKLSSAFRKTAAVKRVSSAAKEVLWKYFKKVKPLYEKLSQKRQEPPPANTGDQESMAGINYSSKNISQSFSGNLMYPRRRRSYVSSCPSSMMSSPRHGDGGFGLTQAGRVRSGLSDSDSSSMEEWQSAIQGAIAHCKNSMMKNNDMICIDEL